MGGLRYRDVKKLGEEEDEDEIDEGGKDYQIRR